MKKLILILWAFFTTTIYSYGQTFSVKAPDFKDKYSDYVKKLEAGQNDIDYHDFRLSFIESEQFKIANKKSTELANLKKEMYTQMDKSNFEELLQSQKKCSP